ncbi:MAG TPA: substrate-binding domain-containing protein, partial [Acetobacteraceae bacterium]|nr:substrate-binding domain-containing protein [Acetobacteraceae bacterium]
MNIFKKTLLAAGAALLALAGTAHAQAVKRVTIAMVTHGEAVDPFWTKIKNGADLAAKQMDVNLQYRAPNTFNMVKMADLIQAAVNQRPAGLIVTIPDEQALGPAIKKAVAEGIPVIAMNTGRVSGQKLGAMMYVGEGNYAGGVQAGKRFAAMGAQLGLCLNQEVGQVALDRRCQGFAKGFGKKVIVLPTSEDATTVESQVEAALRRNPKIDAILANSAPLGGEPAVAAIQKLGLTRKVYVGSFDLSPGFLQDLASGTATFALDQQPFLQGYLSV